MAIPRDGDLPRLALDKANLHHAFVDALGGQHCPASHISLLPIEIRDFPCHLLQVFYRDLTANIGTGDSSYLLLGQNLRRTAVHLLQLETGFCPSFFCRSLLPLLNFALPGGLVFRDLFHHLFPLHLPAGSFHLGTGIHATLSCHSKSCIASSQHSHEERCTKRIDFSHHLFHLSIYDFHYFMTLSVYIIV